MRGGYPVPIVALQINSAMRAAFFKRTWYLRGIIVVCQEVNLAVQEFNSYWDNIFRAYTRNGNSFYPQRLSRWSVHAARGRMVVVEVDSASPPITLSHVIPLSSFTCFANRVTIIRNLPPSESSDEWILPPSLGIQIKVTLEGRPLFVSVPLLASRRCESRGKGQGASRTTGSGCEIISTWDVAPSLSLHLPLSWHLVQRFHSIVVARECKGGPWEWSWDGRTVDAVLGGWE